MPRFRAHELHLPGSRPAMIAGAALTLALASTTGLAAQPPPELDSPPVEPLEAETPAQDASPPPSLPEVLAASPAADWRPLDPEETLVLELPSGRVVLELAPAFAPLHVANVKTLVRQGYFDGLAVLRSQDNYVAQWGDPDADDPEQARSFGEAQPALPAELDRAADGAPFTPLPDGDVYAPEAGFSLGFPAARDPEAGTLWLAHCYGMVGVARGNEPGSGSGAGLYAVTGHAPRHLDRNITLLGRVVEGIEHLSTLPRGTGPLGFYQEAEQRVPIRRVRVAADLPAAERPGLEVLRTESASFEAVIASRRHRHEAWFLHPVGRIELCNVPLPVREAPAPAAAEPEDRAPEAQAHPGDAHGSWSYQGGTGPAHWGSLDPSFGACAAGSRQSPIDLAGAETRELAGIVFRYRPGGSAVRHLGHTVQVDYQPGSWLELDGIGYQLLQLHLHLPSEHAVDGRSFPAEAHLVHRSEGGDLAVLGVLLEEGAEPSPLAPLSALAITEGEERSLTPALDAAAFLPPRPRLYRYDGSLTTPPCSEGVQWLVLAEPLGATAAELEALAAMVSGNNRPLQPRHDRPLEIGPLSAP